MMVVIDENRGSRVFILKNRNGFPSCALGGKGVFGADEAGIYNDDIKHGFCLPSLDDISVSHKG